MILKQYQIPQKTKQLVERGVEKIILDLSAVNYINSSMLGMISSITKQGKQLAIVCRTRSFPYQLLQQCQVFSFINRYDNIISAIVE
jgi:anti-anti-sigma regulatory factor